MKQADKNKNKSTKKETKVETKKEPKVETKKESSPKKIKIVGDKNQAHVQKTDKFPKNVNEFRHIMDDVNCCVADIEYMLELRRHKKISSVEKGIVGNGPSFYDDDFQKYKKKLEKKPIDEKQFLQTNIGRYRQIFGDRTKYAINDSLYKFEVTLRNDLFSGSKSVQKSKDGKINIITRNKTPWDSTVIPKEKSLFDTLLPPILSKSRELFNKIDDKVGRPVIQVDKEGYINGEKVKRRVFDYNHGLALRYPSDHSPSSKYINDYGIQNVGAIKHLLNCDNRTMSSYWSTYLRGEKKKKFLPEEIKQREKRLRDRSSEKSYPKS